MKPRFAGATATAWLFVIVMLVSFLVVNAWVMQDRHYRSTFVSACAYGLFSKPRSTQQGWTTETVVREISGQLFIAAEGIGFDPSSMPPTEKAFQVGASGRDVALGVWSPVAISKTARLHLYALGSDGSFVSVDDARERERIASFAARELNIDLANPSHQVLIQSGIFRSWRMQWGGVLNDLAVLTAMIFAAFAAHRFRRSWKLWRAVPAGVCPEC